VGFGVVGIVFFVTARFRLPAVPLLLVAASRAIVEAAIAARGRHWKKLALQSVVVLVAGTLCWPTWFGSPDEGWVRDEVNLGNSLRQAGDLEGAADAYRQALARGPDDPDANYLMGRLLLARNPAAAVAHFETARKAVPRSPDLLLALGQAQRTLGRPEEARQTLSELTALEEQLNLWPARASWATAHIMLAEIDPGQADAHWAKAWSIDRRTAAEVRFFQRQESDRVLETFRAEAREKPWDWYSRANFGMALLETGRGDEAVPQLREAVRLAPTREGLAFQLARALIETDRKEEAFEILDQLARELPDCPLRRQVRTLRGAIE